MTSNDELTVRDLHYLLSENFSDLKVSQSSVKRSRQNLGWVSTVPRYCQLIREINKEKRLAFCKQLENTNDTFENILWTGECSVQLERHSKRCYRKKGKPKKLKPRPKQGTFVGCDFLSWSIKIGCFYRQT